MRDTARSHLGQWADETLRRRRVGTLGWKAAQVNWQAHFLESSTEGLVGKESDDLAHDTVGLIGLKQELRVR